MRKQQTPTYQTRELSKQTWPDFEKLFSRGNGWDFCWCMAFHNAPRASRTEFRTRREVSVRNHQDKKDLLDQGAAHGVLVYADGEPVGWCQYGSSQELCGRSPAEPPSSEQQVWRITCFVVDRKHRRKGVAGVALRAALEAIRNKGGGLVEAYPVACWTDGTTGSEQAVYVGEVGPVAPAWGGFGNVSTSGVVSMFEKEGFAPVAVCGPASARVRAYGADGCYVLMRKHL
jgi:GNAT superfamily N-acetyltransferase